MLPESVDVAIIGGGATGLGAAVDAASRGHSVLLIEQSDFAKGTSSRSTKLVHGGVRYLRQGNLSLVLEALHERERLYQNAPHLVHALPFVIPGYEPWELPFYSAGLLLYDLLAGPKNRHRSRVLSRGAVQERLPTLRSERLKGGVLYFDGQFDDTQLALALVRTAQAHGAIVENYVRCDRLLKRNGKVLGLTATELASGTTFDVQARCVINATGVFVDTLRQQDQPEKASLLSVSQGIHLVLPKRFLPNDTALMIPKTADGRVLFALPWQGAVLLGTTDTAVGEPTLEPRALPEEVTFLLEHAAKYLTSAPQRSDVLSVFAGLRPLVRRGGGASTAALSRDHYLETAPSGLITITGGKWTTYRKMAQDVIDAAERTADLPKRPCQTQNLGLSRLDAPLTLLESVRWHVHQTQAKTVEDYLARRTRALLLNARASAELAPQVAAILAAELRWSEAQRRQQVEQYQILASEYAIS